jgi:hypothetical protein
MCNSETSDDWIHEVRFEIYESTKIMSNKELNEYFRKRGEEIAKKMVLQLCSSKNQSYRLKP